uniref:Uncharacterized protein n=1 Tax=Rhipicephalus pulchellus TaxID=72859 RepID=L7LVJ8_RHIPC
MVSLKVFFLPLSFFLTSLSFFCLSLSLFSFFFFLYLFFYVHKISFLFCVTLLHACFVFLSLFSLILLGVSLSPPPQSHIALTSVSYPLAI